MTPAQAALTSLAAGPSWRAAFPFPQPPAAMAMESRAKLAGHPVHQMLVTVPLGLLSTAVVFDALAAGADDDGHADTARTMIGAGLVGGALAAPFGWVDWFAIPEGTRAKRLGLLHGLGNAVVLGLFGASYLLRRGEDRPSGAAVALSTAGLALAAVTGWLGGELVDRLGVGVSPGAHLDAPSSLTHEAIPQAERPLALADEATLADVGGR